MGVYIKGMEMPKNCYECQFAASYFRPTYTSGRNPCSFACVLTQKALTSTKRNRFCPLVPVPKHGRLIDAGALIDAIIAKYIRHERNRELVFAVAEIKQDIADIINELPTILEAEEGE